MFKKLLYVLFITDRIKLEPDQMTITFLILYFISFVLVTLSGQVFAVVALHIFVKIAVWICIAWLWADVLWLNKYSWLRDRGKYL